MPTDSQELLKRLWRFGSDTDAAIALRWFAQLSAVVGCSSVQLLRIIPIRDRGALNKAFKPSSGTLEMDSGNPRVNTPHRTGAHVIMTTKSPKLCSPRFIKSMILRFSLCSKRESQTLAHQLQQPSYTTPEPLA